MSTLEQRRISHELVMAWWDVQADARDELTGESEQRMYTALDRIIAAFTPGYNAEEPPEWVCPHEPEHMVHLHYGENGEDEPDRYDCDPECAVEMNGRG